MLIDLSRPVTYRSIDINDATLVGDNLIGTQIKRVRPGAVDGVGYIEKKAGSDGMNASDVWQAGRTILMECVTYAASRGDLSDRLQNILAALTPRSAYTESPGDKGFLPLQFYAPTARVEAVVINSVEVAQWSSGEITCFVNARPKAQPQFLIDRDATGADDNDALAIEWSVAFDCIDPRIYISPRIDTSLVQAGAGDATHTLYNRGTYPVPLNFYLVNEAVSGTAHVTITGAGSDLVLTIPNDAAKDRIVRVSSTDQIVTSQLTGEGQTLAMSYMANMTNRVWPSIEPGGWAEVRVVNDKKLKTGSAIWYYEAFA
jgi:hypothetical protein